MAEQSGLPLYFVATAALAFGLAVGSFLNVVIFRLPRGESLARPASHCPSCGGAIAVYDNIPVFGYLWLGGRCRRCRARISPRYPAIELLTGLVFAAIACQLGAVLMMPITCVFAAGLIAAAAIDLEHRIIPDEISLGGLAVAMVLVPGAKVLSGAMLFEALAPSVMGALVGGGVLWTVGFAHARFSTAIGRHFEHWPGPDEAVPKPMSLDYWIWFPGVGFGDVKLLAMIGAVVGPLGVLETILVASIAGLVLGVGWAAVTGKWSTPFGFGPAIAAGALTVVLVPTRIIGLF